MNDRQGGNSSTIADWTIINETQEPMADPLEDTKAALGKLLFEQLERMDPSYDERRWDDLDGGEQDIYIHAIVNTVRFGEEDILKLLGRSA